jgi:protein phosphatase 4 regulatory subunit 3
MLSEDIQPRKDLCMHRVKLYKLNQQGHWDDKGTGHVGIEFLPVRSSAETC